MDNVTGFGEGGRGSTGITGGRRVVRVGLELPSSSDCHNLQLYESSQTIGYMTKMLLLFINSWKLLEYFQKWE